MSSIRSFVLAVALGGAALIPLPQAAAQTGTWKAAAPMPAARAEIAVAAIGGRIYAVGGVNAPGEVEIYDPAADKWSRGAAVPRPIHHPAAVGLDGKLYLIGGYVDGWSPTDEVHEYDPVANRWRALAQLLQF